MGKILQTRKLEKKLFNAIPKTLKDVKFN